MKSECLKLDVPEMAEKYNLLSLPSNFQLISDFVKKCKNLSVKGGRDDYLFWMNAQNIYFFSAA